MFPDRLEARNHCQADLRSHGLGLLPWDEGEDADQLDIPDAVADNFYLELENSLGLSIKPALRAALRRLRSKPRKDKMSLDLERSSASLPRSQVSASLP